MKPFLAFLVSLLALTPTAVIAQAPGLAGPRLRAGAAKVDISPTKADLAIATDSVRDHLYVSAVFLDDGRSRAAIVTVDAGGLGDDVVKAAIAQSSAATGCPPENYIISATHTHSGRSGANVTQITTAAIVQAVNEARAKLAPASRLPCPSPSSNHASSPITVRRGPQLRRGMKSLSEHHRSPPQDLGRRLRLRRLQLGLTQKQAGLCVGASPASFRSWELGRKPGRGHLPALLVFLGSRSGSGRRA